MMNFQNLIQQSYVDYHRLAKAIDIPLQRRRPLFLYFHSNFNSFNDKETAKVLEVRRIILTSQLCTNLRNNYGGATFTRH